MDTLVVLLALGMMLFFWWDSAGARERAREVARDCCARVGVQFLDDSVELIRLRLRRNTQGRLCFQRRFRFEFSSTGEARFRGQVDMLGKTAEGIHMDPYPP